MGNYCACMKCLETCIERKTHSPMCQVMVILGFGKGVLLVKFYGTKREYCSGCVRDALNLGWRLVFNEWQKLTRGFIAK